MVQKPSLAKLVHQVLVGAILALVILNLLLLRSRARLEDRTEYLQGILETAEVTSPMSQQPGGGK